MTYRERLSPSPWLLVACLLLIPAGMLVFAPIDLVTGIIAGAMMYVVVAALLLAIAPTVGVGDDGLRAGAALLPLNHVGEAEVLDGAAAVTARGPGLDARAFTLFRPGIRGAVRVANTDPADPAPYWLINTRRPTQFAAAIADATGRGD